MESGARFRAVTLRTKVFSASTHPAGQQAGRWLCDSRLGLNLEPLHCRNAFLERRILGERLAKVFESFFAFAERFEDVTACLAQRHGRGAHRARVARRAGREPPYLL